MPAIPLHPFLLGVYFVLALLGLNISQAFPTEALRSVLVVLVFSGALFILLRLMYKNALRGALASSLVLLLFFTYGQVYHLLEKSIPVLGRHRIMLPLWLLLGALGLYLLARRIQDPLTLTRALNLAAVVALAFPIFQVAHWEVNQRQGDPAQPSSAVENGSLSYSLGDTSPDVYFFVLDSYARQDVLKQFYDFDNSVFITALQGLGFDIVRCSQANYSQTELVLTSILNMNYLDKLGDFAPTNTDPLALRSLIKNNAVMLAFRKMGYKLVSFETGFHFSEFYDADYYLSPSRNNLLNLGGMNSFELMLFKSTAGLVLYDTSQLAPPFLTRAESQPLETKRQQVRFDLQELETLPTGIAGPKFVFVHLLVLHDPFVFSSTGEAVNYPDGMDKGQELAAYRSQLEFLNSRLLPILENIITTSRVPPVIILQGDTGPGLVSHAGRVENLSAFYLPGEHQPFSSSLSPVNDFRLVFNQYFGTRLALLPDNSFFSVYTSPFDFELIPNGCSAGE